MGSFQQPQSQRSRGWHLAWFACYTFWRQRDEDHDAAMQSDHRLGGVGVHSCISNGVQGDCDESREQTQRGKAFVYEGPEVEGTEQGEGAEAQ
jgi:hypothetical protein